MRYHSVGRVVFIHVKNLFPNASLSVSLCIVAHMHSLGGFSVSCALSKVCINQSDVNVFTGFLLLPFNWQFSTAFFEHSDKCFSKHILLFLTLGVQEMGLGEAIVNSIEATPPGKII